MNMVRYKPMTWWMNIWLWRERTYLIEDLVNHLFLTVKVYKGNLYIVDYQDTIITKRGTA